MDLLITFVQISYQKNAEFYIAQKKISKMTIRMVCLLEHMAFNGTKNFESLSITERIGVKFGANINAYTSLDETVYNLSDVPTTRESVIDSALLVLHDWSSLYRHWERNWRRAV